MKIADLATPRMQAAIRGALEKWFADGLDDESFSVSWYEDGTFEVWCTNPRTAHLWQLQADKLGRSSKSTGAGAVAEILQEIRK